jgi:hypothetical protein
VKWHGDRSYLTKFRSRAVIGLANVAVQWHDHDPVFFFDKNLPTIVLPARSPQGQIWLHFPGMQKPLWVIHEAILLNFNLTPNKSLLMYAPIGKEWSDWFRLSSPSIFTPGSGQGMGLILCLCTAYWGQGRRGRAPIVAASSYTVNSLHIRICKTKPNLSWLGQWENSIGSVTENSSYTAVRHNKCRDAGAIMASVLFFYTPPGSAVFSRSASSLPLGWHVGNNDFSGSQFAS